MEAGANDGTEATAKDVETTETMNTKMEEERKATNLAKTLKETPEVQRETMDLISNSNFKSF